MKLAMNMVAGWTDLPEITAPGGLQPRRKRSSCQSPNASNSYNENLKDDKEIFLGDVQ